MADRRQGNASGRDQQHRSQLGMNADALPFFELVAPLTFVFGAIYLLSPMLTLSRPSPRMLVFGIVWLVIARYLDWRLFTTVMPAGGEWYEVGWVWFCFAVEILALFDALILYLAFLRTSDRSGEADMHDELHPVPKTPS